MAASTRRNHPLAWEMMLVLDLEKMGGVEGRVWSGKECPGREEPVVLNLHPLVQLKPGHLLGVRGGDGLRTGVWSSPCRKQTRT